jgi:DNA-binding SARP family transcriptional activator/tetratricopeptide (TPR) repeat protein
MVRLDLTLFGGFLARIRGEPLTLPTKKIQALLAYLALPVGHAHQRDKLASLLWGGTPDASARNSFRQALFVLRKALASSGDVLRIERDTLALDRDAVEVDAMAFERAVADGMPAALEKAATLYQGDLLAGLAVAEAPFEEWLLSERERFRELALEGLAKLLVHQRSAGSLEGAIRTALRMAALDPLQESVHRTLMRLFVRSGRRGAALRQYQQCVSALQRELGAEPEAETKALYGEILRARSSREQQDEVASGHPTDRRRRSSGARDVVDAEQRLVGRDVEVAELGRALDHAMGGRGMVVAIVGEAGVGKTSLLAKLEAAARLRGVQVLAGRCYESAQVLPFGPWAEAFRGDEKALRSCVETLEPIWQAELARILPEVGAPGLPVVGDDRLPLFEAVGRLVDALAGAQPLLIALEDVHWADEMSLRLFSFLARRRRGANVLIVVTSREEEMVDAPTLLTALDELYAKGSLVRMNLAPLSRDDAGVLVRALARAGADEATLERLTAQAWALSEGNPFVIVETLRAFQEGTEVRPTPELPMPERVRRLVATRLERLGERERQLLAAAAIIGREFEFALLSRAADLNEHDAARGVEELVRRRLFQVVGEQLNFTHDRIRKVLDDGLLPPSRRVLHVAVAQAMEALYTSTLDAHAPALGLHYREGGVWDRAVIFLALGAAQALSRSAYKDAAAWYEQTLAGLAHLPATRENLERAVDARVGLGNATYFLGEVAASLEQLKQAEKIAEVMGDALHLGRTLLWLTRHAWISGRPEAVQTYGERTLAIAEEADDGELRAMANYYLGHGFLVAGDLPRAMARFREVALILDLTNKKHPFLRGSAHRSYLAWCLAERGQFSEAIPLGLDAIHDAEASELAHALVQAWSTLTHVHALRGDYPRSVELAERALAIAQAREVVLFLPLQQWLVGHAWACSGRIAEGLSLIRKGLEQLEAWEMWLWVPLVTIHLGEICLLGGLIDEAREHAARALGLTRELGQRLYEAYALRLVGESLATEDAAGAEESYRSALVLAEELGLRPVIAHCHLGLGKLYGCTGRRDQAREHLTTATTMYRDMDMRHWLEQAEAEIRPLA